MKKLLIPVLILSLFLCGCSSSNSGGSDAPAANYSGYYNIILEGMVTSESATMMIVQSGDNAAVDLEITKSYYILLIEKNIFYQSFFETIGNEVMLQAAGIAEVKGRKIDVTWEGGPFTRLEFTADGSSFNGYGDFSIAGVKID